MKWVSSFLPLRLYFQFNSFNRLGQIPFKFQTWRKNEIIQKQGSPIQSVHWILSGSCLVSRILPFLELVKMVVLTDAIVSVVIEAEIDDNGSANTLLSKNKGDHKNSKINLNLRSLKPWTEVGSGIPNWLKKDISVDCQVLEEGNLPC